LIKLNACRGGWEKRSHSDRAREAWGGEKKGSRAKGREHMLWSANHLGSGGVLEGKRGNQRFKGAYRRDPKKVIWSCAAEIKKRLETKKEIIPEVACLVVS